VQTTSRGTTADAPYDRRGSGEFKETVGIVERCGTFDEADYVSAYHTSSNEINPTTSEENSQSKQDGS